MKKLFCVILALLMLFSAAACSKSGGENETEPTDEELTETGDSQATTAPAASFKANFTLPYCETDTVNPYRAKTQLNRNITTLIYDGLYSLDEKFMPAGVIAKSEEITNEYVTVALRDDVHFTDSKVLSARDVVYSFEQAKSSDRYGTLLSGVEKALAIENYTVRFTLSSPDKFVRNILTFPVIEFGTAAEKVPTGSGRYTFSTTGLSYNKEHISGKKPSIKNIGLYSMTEKTNVVNSLQIGNISFIFKDLSDCEIQRAVAQSVPVTLNNLVYLGINSENALLSDSVLRQVVAMAIDKEAIAGEAYQSYAVKTETPFNPLWGETKEKEKAFNQAQAAELLEKNGYVYKNGADKYRSSENGKTLYFRIIVTSGNEFRTEAAKNIAKNLSQVGIGTEVVTLGFSKYKDRVKDGNFDLYLGEVKLCENMSLSPFFSKNGKAHYGIDLKDKIITSYEKLLKGEKTVSQFEEEFLKASPFIPICYRNGIVMASNTISDNIKSVSTDMFSNIYEWKMN